MINNKSIKFVSTLVLVLVALILLPGQTWAAAPVDGDGDGFNNKKDCVDNNPDIYPGAPEICDELDNQCPGDSGYGTTDEGCGGGACNDSDFDGFFAENDCGTDVDCDDGNAAVYPSAPEICDGVIDHNCDGFTDESCTACTDTDEDGYFAEAACDDNPIDCDDSLAAVNPAAMENCGTDYDDNCDDQANEGCPVAGGDSDGDGLSDADEINNGVTLSSEFDLLTDSGWVGPSAFIPGSSMCGSGEKCLNSTIGDLFIIWRQLPAAATKIDLASCNIFEFASNPVSNFTVWVLRERSGPSLTRQITASSDQKAPVLIEDSEMSGTTGYSLPGTIMSANGGLSWLYSHQIASNVDLGCYDDCKVEDIVMTNQEIKCRHFNNTAIHEILHVMFALSTSDGHIADDIYIMYPATVYTQQGNKPGVYTIADEFSPSALTDPQFR